MNNIVPVRFLLVEDNQDHADLMINSLTDFNETNEITHMLDGEAALAHLNNVSFSENNKENLAPHLILLDIRMPKIDGISLLKKIKENKNLKSIPVIMVSTSKLESEIAECYRLGACGFVNKTLQFDEFTHEIKKLNRHWYPAAKTPNLPKSN